MLPKKKRTSKPSRNGRHTDGVGAGDPKQEEAHDEQFRKRRKDRVLFSRTADDPDRFNPGCRPPIGRKKHNSIIVFWLGYGHWLRSLIEKRRQAGHKYSNDMLSEMQILICEIVYWTRAPEHPNVDAEDIGKPRAGARYSHRTSDGKWWIVARCGAWAKKFCWSSKKFVRRLLDRLIQLGVVEVCPFTVGSFGPSTRLVRVKVEDCPHEFNPDRDQ